MTSGRRPPSDHKENIISTAYINAHVVRGACVDYLEDRQARLNAEREVMIQAAMQPLRFGPITLRRARTREQAIKWLSRDQFDAYGMLGIWAGRERSMVEELLRLADAAIATGTKNVCVSARHASIIF